MSSPECAAWLNYSLVVGLGALTWFLGDRGYYGALRDTGLRWLSFSWYLILVADLLVLPLGIFWLLDWAGVANDTSVFAALATVFVYSRISDESSSASSAPASLASFTEVFSRIGKLLAQRVLRTVANYNRRIELIAAEKAAGSPKKLGIVLQEVLTRAGEPEGLKVISPNNHDVYQEALKARLARIEAAAKDEDGAPDESEAAQRKATLLLGELRGLVSPGEYDEFIRRRGLVDRFDVVPVARLLLIGLLFLAVGATARSVGMVPQAAETRARMNRVELRYQHWRLVKARNTTDDRQLADDHFRSLLSPAPGAPGFSVAQKAVIRMLGSSLISEATPEDARRRIIIRLLEARRGTVAEDDVLFDALLEGSRAQRWASIEQAQNALIELAQRDAPKGATLPTERLTEKSMPLDGFRFASAWRDWIAAAAKTRS